MSRKTKILKRLDKFGVKYANHPLLKNKKEEIKTISSLVEDLPQPIKEEVFEPTSEPTIVEEAIEVKRPDPPKKTVKPKK